MRAVPGSECVAVEYVVRVTAQADGTNREGLWVCAVGKILVVAVAIGAVMLSAVGDRHVDHVGDAGGALGAPLSEISCGGERPNDDGRKCGLS
jgi:hypothetical protein